ncbi:pregnancy-specific glycoprotein 22-like [Peromyscus californicus insignis]|uniref:pregnancy-specific glycoprotein 22-like n=1 Tax=Peromyscus californicus insignis TaxID=564181 RepID=UPI0022A6D0F1|nr:pregnancy-specific glycoprotein 22-like [Peromyscus californicus insignis]
MEASILTCWHLSATDHITIKSVPSQVANGDNVLLLVNKLPEDLLNFAWFKGESGMNLGIAIYAPDRDLIMQGPGYSGRETVYRNGSLLIQNVNEKDTGLYTLQTLNEHGDVLSVTTMRLHVYPSISLCCNLLTSSQTMIQPVPRFPAEGEGVLLQVHNLPEDLLNFVWYKSKYGTPVLKIVEYSRDMNSVFWGPAYRGRGMVYYNGSLMLQNVTEKDAGIYTLEVLKKNSKIEKASVEFNVKKNVSQPFVRVTDTTVEGRRSVTFTCISPDTDISIRWIFNNRSLHHLERVTLSPTKCGLRIDSVGREDAGEYKCEVTNGVSLKTSLPVWWP